MTTDSRTTTRVLLNKVPEVTIFFWIIKILATTVGETFADWLSDNVGLGLTTTTIVMGTGLIVALVFQFRARRYQPPLYWITVVLISVVGTCLTDILTDKVGIDLVWSTTAFAIGLAITFSIWYAREGT